METDTTQGPMRLLAVAAAWVALTWLALNYGIYALPVPVRRLLDLETYNALMQVASAAAGLGLLAAIAPPARDALGLRAPLAAWQALRLVIAAPVVFILSLVTAIAVALPTLLAEIQRGGAAAANENKGAFGQVAVESPLPLALLGFVLIAPLTEELLFRGALWSALARLFSPAAATAPEGLSAAMFSDPLPVRAGRALVAWARRGGLATLGSTAVFAAMHTGMAGGMGITRVVSAAGLGLACGLARQSTGSLLGPLLLHAVFNLLALGHTRGWLTSETFPNKAGVPTLIAAVALACLVILAAVAVARRTRPAVIDAED